MGPYTRLVELLLAWASGRVRNRWRVHQRVLVGAAHPIARVLFLDHPILLTINVPNLFGAVDRLDASLPL